MIPLCQAALLGFGAEGAMEEPVEARCVLLSDCRELESAAEKRKGDWRDRLTALLVMKN